MKWATGISFVSPGRSRIYFPWLGGVSLKFRKNEFVSILGASGCGKTTMLNIVGGLDRYTSGDLIINGTSTKKYKDRDWDTYRNHSVGFVFQSYNLIPHQTVLSNVELALTLSGVSKTERRQRAKEALEKVGLGDQLTKKPSQMSGGQMQRVAIARALVNNPEILLADEPTGALDTATSVQIMDLLKEVAKDRLVIMVTHNPELAEEYSTRIVRLSDGLVISDSDPYDGEDETTEAEAPAKKDKSKGKKKKTSMSFFTAISLSMKNLLTKKGRTVLTSFAGSIGIIGIALILAVSQGVTGFINDIQRETLSSFPISIYAEEADVMSMMNAMMQTTEGSLKADHEMDAVYGNPILHNLIQSINNTEIKKNDLKPFKAWVDDRDNHDLGEHVSGVHYTYDVNLNMYVKDPEGNYTKADINELFSDLMGTMSSSSSMMSMGSSFSSVNVWCEMIPGAPAKDGEEQELISDMIYDQYTLVDGEWPDKANEVVLILSPTNEISDIVLYALGYRTKAEMTDVIMSAFREQSKEDGATDTNTEKKELERIEYSDIIGKKYKLILNDAYYNYNKETGLYEDVSDKKEVMKLRVEDGYDVTISGIIKPKEDAGNTILSGNLAYTSALTEYVIEETLKTKLAIAQTAPENANFDVFTGLPFIDETKGELTDDQKLAALDEYLAEATAKEKAELYLAIMTTPDDKYVNDELKNRKELFGLGELSSAELREKLADMLSTQEEMGGLDSETILTLMDSYTDKEIETMLDDYIKESIITEYKETEKAKIIAAVSTPSAEQLAGIKAMIEGEILKSMNKMLPEGTPPFTEVTDDMRFNVVLDDYTRALGISAADAPMEYMKVYNFLKSGYTTEEINAKYDGIITAQAAELAPKPSETELNERIAALLDEHVKNADKAAKLKAYGHMPDGLSPNTYDDNLKLIGICDIDEPNAVHIYASTFEAKDTIKELIKGDKNSYNSSVDDEQKIDYTDYVEALMGGVTTIIEAISAVLIAFVSISLVVSSVMIGIITNISVLERTKEIGILRAIGASKRDVSRVFNAETFIIGSASGILGILTTVLLCFPINWIIRWVTNIPTLTASLPVGAAIALVVISMALTMIAGIIPARNASKKDPVEALRSE